MILPRRRLAYALGFLACAGLMAFALVLQYRLGEDPCPLCIFQRVAMMALGVVFLLAALHNPAQTGARIYAVLLAVAAGTGAGIAARHVWLQHLPPDQVPACGPGLSYILQAHPFLNALEVVLRGSGECATVGWTFLSLSIPQWTLLWFVLLGALGVSQAFNRR
jgi:disulfide bond formation protein DsbB